MAGTGWGRIFIASRREKVTLSEHDECWSMLITTGIRKGDSYSICSGQPAHWAANELATLFLKSECDSILYVDSDSQFTPDVLGKLRDLEEGWGYDVLQAFYVRRGWPPEAIWMRQHADGGYRTMAVLRETTEPVDAVGLHFTLIRRAVFETLPGPDWFYYPRRKDAGEARKSEDVAFCEAVRGAGFKVGATSKVKTGHYSTVPTGYETHQEWLRANAMIEKYGVHPDGTPIVPDAFVGVTNAALPAPIQ